LLSFGPQSFVFPFAFSTHQLKYNFVWLFYMCVKVGLSHLRKENRVTALENTVLRKIYGPKRKYVGNSISKLQIQVAS
jgi:hypothetical protein